MEQKYIDTLLPDYNIAKITGSVLNTKWSLDSKIRRRASAQFKEHLEKLRLINTGKKLSAETKALLKSIVLKITITDETKKKMSLNNNKSVKIIAYFSESNLVYKEFISCPFSPFPFSSFPPKGVARRQKQLKTFLMI